MRKLLISLLLGVFCGGCSHPSKPVFTFGNNTPTSSQLRKNPHYVLPENLSSSYKNKELPPNPKKSPEDFAFQKIGIHLKTQHERAIAGLGTPQKSDDCLKHYHEWQYLCQQNH